MTDRSYQTKKKKALPREVEKKSTGDHCSKETALKARKKKGRKGMPGTGGLLKPAASEAFVRASGK